MHIDGTVIIIKRNGIVTDSFVCNLGGTFARGPPTIVVCYYSIINVFVQSAVHDCVFEFETFLSPMRYSALGCGGLTTIVHFIMDDLLLQIRIYRFVMQ